MLRMRKADHDKQWVVEEIELGDVTRPLQLDPCDARPWGGGGDFADADVEVVAGTGRHTTFKVDGLVAVTTAVKVGAGVTVGFLLLGGPILCCVLTVTLFYLLVEYSTKAERQQEAEDLARMEQGGGGVFGVARFVAGQCAVVYQRLVALKQSVVNYSLTVSIAESQAMLDLDEIVRGGASRRRRRRRSSLLPCVESECDDAVQVDAAAVMESIVVVDQASKRNFSPSTPFELPSVRLESLQQQQQQQQQQRVERSQSLPLPVLRPLAEEDLRTATCAEGEEVAVGTDVEALKELEVSALDTEPEEEDDEEEDDDDGEEHVPTDAEVEIEPMIPPQGKPRPGPRTKPLPPPLPLPAETKPEPEPSPTDELALVSPMTAMATQAQASASKALKSASQAVRKLAQQLPSKLQIPVLLSRPLPRLVVHRAPSHLTPSQHVQRMLDEAAKMDAELDAILAQNAAVFQAFEDSRASVEIRRRELEEDELSHKALSSDEEEGEFWYEDTLGAEFLDDVPPYLRSRREDSARSTA